MKNLTPETIEIITGYFESINKVATESAFKKCEHDKSFMQSEGGLSFFLSFGNWTKGKVGTYKMEISVTKFKGEQFSEDWEKSFDKQKQVDTYCKRNEFKYNLQNILIKLDSTIDKLK